MRSLTVAAPNQGLMEFNVLTLIVLCLVLFFSVGVILWAGTLGLQGYIYSEPSTELHWRAPAAAGILAGFLGLWCLLDYKKIDPNTNDIPYDTVFRFSPVESRDYEEFISVKAGKEILYKRHGTGIGVEYLDPQGRPWQRGDTEGIVEEIIVTDQGEKLSFKPKGLKEVPNPSNPDGPKLKYFPKGSDNFPGYYQVGGRRAMLYAGQVSQFRWSMFLINLFLNFLHLGLWFVCLWLLLRFQWLHALGLAIGFWLVTTLVIMPMLLAKTHELALERAAKAAAVSSTWQSVPPNLGVSRGFPALSLSFVLRLGGLYHVPGPSEEAQRLHADRGGGDVPYRHARPDDSGPQYHQSAFRHGML